MEPWKQKGDFKGDDGEYDEDAPDLDVRMEGAKEYGSKEVDDHATIQAAVHKELDRKNDSAHPETHGCVADGNLFACLCDDSDNDDTNAR